MKLHLLDRSDLQNKSLSVNFNSYPHFLKVWHYHEQLELVVILKSTGTRFVGDSIEKFSEGEIVLLGKNLPHMWANDKKYFNSNSTLIAQAIAIHFKEDFLGNAFLKSPEMMPIGQLFEKAKAGIKFTGDNHKIIADIQNMIDLNDFDRIIKFTQILNQLAKETNFELLSNSVFLNSFQITENKKLDNVYSFIFNNFKNPISLNDIAEIAQMNPTTFSRHFKKISRKTFSRYLNEIRIGYACKLLMEQKYNVIDVCYESGFNNLSNFNRQFKVITHHSPTEYIKVTSTL